MADSPASIGLSLSRGALTGDEAAAILDRMLAAEGTTAADVMALVVPALHIFASNGPAANAETEWLRGRAINLLLKAAWTLEDITGQSSAAFFQYRPTAH